MPISPRLPVCVFTCLLCAAGCMVESDHASGNRAAPVKGTNTDPVVYERQNPGAIQVAMVGTNFRELVATPTQLAVEPSIEANRPMLFEGRLEKSDLPNGMVRVEFFREDSRSGKVITGQAIAFLKDDGDGYKFSIVTKSPKSAGPQTVEIQYIENQEGATAQVLGRGRTTIKAEKKK